MGLPALKSLLPNRLTRRRTSSKLLLLLFGLAAFASILGCYNSRTGDASVGGAINFKLPAFPETGSNAVQVFTEMHYQPSYRAQEVPRRLPPDGSVPTIGAEVVYASMDEYKKVVSPGGDAQNGRSLYDINCQVCHGSKLDGKGKITEFAYSGGPLPADLNVEVTRTATAGELFGFISCGGRQGCAMRLLGRPSASPMPEFRRLLSEQERWDLVAYLEGAINAP